MPPSINLIGYVFGKLTVIERAENHKGRAAYWHCKCECGNESTVRSSHLRGGATQSCGCLRKRPIGVASLNEAYQSYKRNAKKRNLCWEITKSDFKFLSQLKCCYCGGYPSNELRRNKHRYNGSVLYNGIDRIDSNIGYTYNNVVPCCRKCNVAKSNYSLSEFMDWVEQIYEYSIPRRVKGT